MRPAFAFVLFCACGGPSTDQLVETPSATVRQPQTEAPPASVADKDRERLIQQFDDMQTTQQAYEEAGQAERTQAPPAPVGQSAPGQAPPPKKKGPAEQATLPKKTGPAEQAPRSE